MSKRIKKVFSSGDQVLHLWANQTQSDARSTNVFFKGDTCYSYGYHYQLGKLHKFKGRTIAVINSERYSVTTAKHQNWAYQAVEHLPRLYSSDVNSIETGLIETQDKLISDLFDFFSGKRYWYRSRKDLLGGYMFTVIKDYNHVCYMFDREDMLLEVPDEFIDLMYAHVKLCHKQEAELNSPDNLAKKQARALVKAKAQVDAWRSGSYSTKVVRSLNPQLLRVVGDEVQTSRGARVPLVKAKRLLELVLKGKAKKGYDIGGFKVSQANSELVTIGCHIVSVKEAIEVLK